MPNPQADRDERFPDRDDHDQPVPLDEVCWMETPTAGPGHERREEPDREGNQPEHGLEAAVHEAGNGDQRRADDRRRRDAEDRQEEIGIATRGQCVERQLHQRHDQEGDAEDDTVTAERIGHGQSAYEHGPARDQHRPPDETFTRIDGVRQPRIRSPRPPERGQEQESVLEAAPGRIAGQQRCDLRERKNEDEVEKELERRDSLLALDRLRAHERTLTRFARRVSRPNKSGESARSGGHTR